MRLAALALAPLLACAEPATIGTPSVDPQVLAACEARVATMRAAFARIPREPSYVKVPDDWRPIIHPVGEPLVEDIRLVLHADGGFGYERAKYRFSAIDQILGEDLVKERRLAEYAKRPFAPTLVLWVDERAEVHELVELLARLPEPLHHALVVYVPTDPAPPPPPTAAVQAALARPPREVGLALRDVLGEAMGMWCDAIPEVFDAMTAERASDRKHPLTDLPAAIVSCHCAHIDVEAMTSALWELYTNHHLRPHMLPLPLSRDPTHPALVLPLEATGKDLVAQVQARGPGPYRLVLEQLRPASPETPETASPRAASRPAR